MPTLGLTLEQFDKLKEVVFQVADNTFDWSTGSECCYCGISNKGEDHKSDCVSIDAREIWNEVIGPAVATFNKSVTPPSQV
jgi:hypothetical protein